MSFKRLMVIGLDGSGKSTLADLVEGAESNHAHREDCFYRTRCFEVPGRYIENHWMHSIIIMLAQNQASALLMLLDGQTGETFYSSGYARAFTCPCLGVLTKAPLEDEARAAGVAKLEAAGCTEVLCVSTETGEGTEELLEWVAAHSGCGALD